MLDTERPTSLACLLALLVALPGLVACATIGPELSPEGAPSRTAGRSRCTTRDWGPTRPWSSTHRGRFGGPPGAVKGHLEGETVKPSTWGVTRKATTSSGDGGYTVSLARNGATVEALPATTVEESQELVRTTWDFDRARWRSGRPFRLVLAAGFGPPDQVVLEIASAPSRTSAGPELQAISAGLGEGRLHAHGPGPALLAPGAGATSRQRLRGGDNT